MTQARVCEDPEPADDEPAGRDVVGGLDGGDLQILDPEAGVKMAHLDGSQPPPARRVYLFADVDGDAEPSRDRADPLAVISVGMGQDDSVDHLHRFAQRGHPGGRFPETLAGIEQYRGPCRLHKIAVAVAPRCDDGQFH